MNLRNSVIKNSLTLLVFQILGRSISFITVPLLAQGLGVKLFGAYSTANTILSIASMIAGLGLDYLMIREIAKQPEQKASIFLDVTLVKLVASVPAILILITFAGVITASSEALYTLRRLAFTLLFDGITISASAYFYGQQKMIQGSLFGLGQSVANLGFVYWAFQRQSGILGIANAFLQSSILIALICMFLLWPVYQQGLIGFLKRHSWARLIRSSLPFMTMSLLLLIYYKIDILFLTLLSGEKSVGIYNSAYRIIDALMFMPAALMGALFPALSSITVARQNDLSLIIEKVIRYLALIGIPAAFGVNLLSPLITQILYGGKWTVTDVMSSCTNLQILIFAWMLVFIDAVCPVVLNAIGRTIINAGITIFGIVINVLLNLYLIPRLDTLGSSWATVLTELAVAILYFIVVNHYVGRFIVVKYIIHPIIGSLVMYASISLIMHFFPVEIWQVVILPFVGMAIYGIYTYFSGAIDIDDLSLLTENWNRFFRTRRA